MHQAAITHSRDQTPETMDDDTLLREGGNALRERLGVEGTLRYLRLLGGGRDRWEDICKAWRGVGVDEALRQMGFPPEPDEESSEDGADEESSEDGAVKAGSL